VAVLAVTVVVLLDQVGSVSDRAIQGAQSVSDSSGGQLGLAVDGVTVGLLSMVQTIAAVAQTAAAVGVVILLSLLLTFYFLRDGGRLWARLVTHVPSDDRTQLDGAGSRAFTVLGGYMIGTAAISFVGAASQFVIMVVLGIPLALPVAVLSFILCFIPYIGGFISTGIAFLLTVATGTPVDVLIMAIWTIVFNIVQGNIVSPLVYGRTVHIHPAVVLLAIPAAAAVAGIMGMFIVVPAIGVVAATWRPIVAMLGARATRVAAEADAPDARAFGADVVGAAPVSGTGA
jgi:putative heme transporter